MIEKLTEKKYKEMFYRIFSELPSVFLMKSHQLKFERIVAICIKRLLASKDIEIKDYPCLITETVHLSFRVPIRKNDELKGCVENALKIVLENLDKYVDIGTKCPESLEISDEALMCILSEIEGGGD